MRPALHFNRFWIRNYLVFFCWLFLLRIQFKRCEREKFFPAFDFAAKDWKKLPDSRQFTSSTLISKSLLKFMVLIATLTWGTESNRETKKKTRVYPWLRWHEDEANNNSTQLHQFNIISDMRTADEHFVKLNRKVICTFQSFYLVDSENMSTNRLLYNPIAWLTHGLTRRSLRQLFLLSISLKNHSPLRVQMAVEKIIHRNVLASIWIPDWKDQQRPASN